jgi:hypothetical protein
VPVYWKERLSPFLTKISLIASKIGPEGLPVKTPFGLSLTEKGSLDVKSP